MKVETDLHAGNFINNAASQADAIVTGAFDLTAKSIETASQTANSLWNSVVHLF